MNSRGIVLVNAERHDGTIMLTCRWAWGKATNMKTRTLAHFQGTQLQIFIALGCHWNHFFNFNALSHLQSATEIFSDNLCAHFFPWTTCDTNYSLLALSMMLILLSRLRDHKPKSKPLSSLENVSIKKALASRRFQVMKNYIISPYFLSNMQD